MIKGTIDGILYFLNRRIRKYNIILPNIKAPTGCLHQNMNAVAIPAPTCHPHFFDLINLSNI